VFDKLKRRLFAKVENRADHKAENLAVDDKKRAETAVCALLIEMAHFDDDFQEEEKRVILNLIEEKFNLSLEEANELMEVAEEERKESIDLWHFAKLINQNYSDGERVELLEMLWKVVYADGYLDGKEDFLAHKLAKLLKLEHHDLIATKLRVNIPRKRNQHKNTFN
jgi:uncharacterized tellurite resistance protein B-like protein